MTEFQAASTTKCRKHHNTKFVSFHSLSHIFSSPPRRAKGLHGMEDPQVHASKLAILVLHPFLMKPHFQVLRPCVDSECLSPTSPRPAEPLPLRCLVLPSPAGQSPPILDKICPLTQPVIAFFFKSLRVTADTPGVVNKPPSLLY